MQILPVLIENKIPKFKKVKMLPDSKTLLSETVKAHHYKGCLDKCKAEINIRLCIPVASVEDQHLVLAQIFLAYGQLACIEFIWRLIPESKRVKQNSEVGMLVEK